MARSSAFGAFDPPIVADAEVIIAVVQELGADAVVMGMHDRRGVSHLFIGSVAEHVVRHSPVPVWTSASSSHAQ